MQGKKEIISTDLCVSHTITVGTGSPVFHFHDVYEILFCRSEGVTFLVNDSIYTPPANSVIVYNNTDVHCSLVKENLVYERNIITFNPFVYGAYSTRDTDLLSCFLSRPPDFEHCVPLDDLEAKQMVRLIDELIYYKSVSQYGTDVLVNSAFLKLLVFVNGLFLSRRSIPVSNNILYQRIRPAIKYIFENYSSKLSLDALAKECCLSKSHLCVLFKKATGVTINKYINAVRVTKAKNLLVLGYAIAEVLELCGFENQSHFNRVFKEFTSNTPSFYIQSKNMQKN